MWVEPEPEGEECDLCERVGEVINFDEGMSESQICEACLIKIYREYRGWSVG